MAEIAAENSTKPERPGCQHYARKCLFISPCCKKFYPCRVCHDEAESHEIDRSAVDQIKCVQCHLVQQGHKVKQKSGGHTFCVQKLCASCGIEFGKYFCEKCRLYDDEDKGQFHCDSCGLCRVGGKSNFFHCKRCDMCLSVKLKGNHKCVEESSRRNCAVCLEDLHTSRQDAHIPPCGHLIHRVCLDQCMKTGNYACPTCNQSMVDMKNMWKVLDAEIASTPMPEEYREYYVYILCKDCHKESRVLFHVIGMKCLACGSYNTCQTARPEGEPTQSQPNAFQNGDVASVNGASSETNSSPATTDTSSASSNTGGGDMPAQGS